MEDKKVILEARNLGIGYRRKTDTSLLLNDINFKLKASSLVGLVGANGIGKSTLLRTLSGMQPTLQGEIYLENQNISEYHPVALAQKLSIVLTEAPASRNLSVQEFVSLGRQPYTNWMGSLTENDHHIIKRALELTKTMEITSRRCYELSDGQMQRVAIARALAQDTPLILLDEPTTHLDIYHRAAVLKLLKELSSSAEKTILFSTHEIDLAIQLSDAMLVLGKDRYYFNDPCSLIEDQCFGDLFPKDVVEFDGKTGRFTIKD